MTRRWTLSEDANELLCDACLILHKEDADPDEWCLVVHDEDEDGICEFVFWEDDE